ncbi:MAG: hypothetical protein D6790_05680, partial [Caldilineae bacterium]
MPHSATFTYVISSHGFGHAARACAVMAALQRRAPALRWEIFTQVPKWFFRESLPGPFTYHDWPTDVGLVQRNALDADLEATLERLNQFLPFRDAQIRRLAYQIQQTNSRAVFCDIAPLGIAAARAAGLPSILVENFTWDWIYQAYADEWPSLQSHMDYLAAAFAAADVHIQTEPVCRAAPFGPVDLTTPPVSRPPRTAPAETRQALGVPRDAPLVLVTMGGVAWEHNNLERLARHPEVHFLLPGEHGPHIHAPDNVHLLPANSGFYHPDLVAASDAVVGKIGYSTLAEVYLAGIPYGYVTRPRFKESAVLAAFVETHMSGVAIPPAHMANARWVDAVPDLLAQPRQQEERINGADTIAAWVR